MKMLEKIARFSDSNLCEDTSLVLFRRELKSNLIKNINQKRKKDASQSDAYKGRCKMNCVQDAAVLFLARI